MCSLPEKGGSLFRGLPLGYCRCGEKTPVPFFVDRVDLITAAVQEPLRHERHVIDPAPPNGPEQTLTWVHDTFFL